MISYIQVLDVFKTFAQGHLQIQKFDFEFREQMPNLATVNEAYPMLFVVPVGGSTLENVREFDIDVYCVDRYQKDRSNVNYVISDTDLILGDLTRWLEEGQNDIEVVRTYTTTPINNDLLDYVGGHVMRMRVQVDRIALCEIPFDGEQPTPPTCPSAIVRNSDGTWSDIVASGGTYIVPDTPVTVTDQDGNPLGSDSLPSVTGGNIEVTIAPSGDGEAVLLDTDGNILSTTPVPPETTVNIVAPDAIAELYFDGELIDTLSILSGGTDSFNIDCFTLLNAVRVESDELSHQHTGTFIHIGEENGKPKYEKDGDPDRVIRYNGTRWILEKLGGGAHTHDAAIGNEDFPWLANWTDAFLLVSQATIGTYCANGAYSYYELVDTDGNVLQTGSIPSGGTSTIVAPDASYLVEYENGTPIQSGTILSGGSETIQVPNPIVCADATVQINGEEVASVASGGMVNIAVENTLGTPVGTFEDGVWVTPDTDLEINGTPEGSFTAGSTIDLQLTDGVNPVTPVSVGRVGDTVTVEVAAGGTCPIGAKPIKTNQLTSYASEDDGDTRRGRLVDFFTLSGNNAFGNTNRFTDLTGGSTFAANGVFLDHATDDGSEILGWTNSPTNSPWDGTRTSIIAQTTDGKTNWFMPNRSELEMLINEDVDRNLNWSPLNVVATTVSVNNFFWTSTTPKNNTARAKAFNNATGTVGNEMTTYGKTLTARSLACRYYTYAELGL
jgi:hypothetical protein